MKNIVSNVLYLLCFQPFKISRLDDCIWVIVHRSNELAIIRTKKDGTPSSTLVELYQDAEANGIRNWPEIQGKRPDAANI